MNDNILEVLVKLSKDNNLDLVVEGVETKEQLDLVIKMGCVVIQGYYFLNLNPYKIDYKYEGSQIGGVLFYILRIT